MKKFKNEFGVVSQSKALLTAFKEEVEKLGWIYDEEFTPWNRLQDNDCLYFADHNDTGACLKPNHFSLSGRDKNTYYLPQQYEEALKAASEVVEEIPEYVEFIDTAHKGKIVKVVEWTPHAYCKVRFFNGDKSEPFKYLVKPSTKEAYDTQNTPKFKVGDWVVVDSNSELINQWSNGRNAIGYIFKLEKGDVSYSNTYEEQIKQLNLGKGCILCPTNKFGINYMKQWLRKATPEEIVAAQIKSFKLGEYTAVVTKDKVEIASRGSLTHNECIEWFEKEFICSDTYSPLGEFTVVENTYTIDIGCVKNVPLKDIEVLYKYLKTL